MFHQQAAHPTGTGTFVPEMNPTYQQPACEATNTHWDGNFSEEAAAIPLDITSVTPAGISCLLQKSRTSWLKGDDLFNLLQHGASGGFPLSTAAADTPPGGTMFLFDRRRTRFFRLDGHNWRKKPDGKTTRETHEKIKVENVERLNCYYAHAVEPFLLQRRCYWLLDNDRIVLVHYLQADAGRKRTASRWNELVEQGLVVGEMGADGPAMPTPSNSGVSGMMKRRRSSIESSRLSDSADYAGYYSQPDSQRVSLEELSRRRHSSMEDSRDAFSMPPLNSSWHPLGGWEALGTTSAHQHANRRPPTAALPWLSFDQTRSEGMLPWDSFAEASPTLGHPPTTFPRHDLLLPSGGSDTANHQQHSNMTYPPMGTPSFVQPESSGRFCIYEVSQQVVSCHGGDRVLIRGSPSMDNTLGAGAYVDVDGACCHTDVVQPGVVSFITQAHPVGPATVMIRDTSGQPISGARTNLFFT